MSPFAALARRDSWPELAADQDGVVAQRQLMAFGLSRWQAEQWVRSGRWQRLMPGVYATFTGPVSFRAQIWAALLYAGVGAAAFGRTALWLEGLLDQRPARIDILIPAHRRVRPQPGLTLRISREAPARIHPAAQPPRERLEEAVLDVLQLESSIEAVLTLIFKVTQRRRTTAARLRDALRRRSRHRWRSLIEDVLEDVVDGVASALERRYRREVERAHRLPAGDRNQPETHGSTHAYRDVRYWEWHTVVELDGREAHPDELRFRDMDRDNGVTLSGHDSLRYGWQAVAGQPCLVALQVVSLLHMNGWTGTPSPCGPTCDALNDQPARRPVHGTAQSTEPPGA